MLQFVLCIPEFAMPQVTAASGLSLKCDALQAVLVAKAHQQELGSHLTAQAELTARLKVATGKQAQAEQLQAAAEQQLLHSQGELCWLLLGLLAGCSAFRMSIIGRRRVFAGHRCCGMGQACDSGMHLSQTAGINLLAAGPSKWLQGDLQLGTLAESKRCCSG